MIRRLTANKSSFRPIKFSSGLNVILAKRTKESTTQDSRNGLGKSTLFEIIHFCLGSSMYKNPLNKTSLMDWSFSLEMDLDYRPITVTRTIADPKVVFVQNAEDRWPIIPQNINDGVSRFDLKDWNLLLGHFCFSLPIPTDKHPSFRSLISYFIRREKDSGFDMPFETYRKQTADDRQRDNAFLLGLSWEDVIALKSIKNRQNELTRLKSSIELDGLGGLPQKIGSLDAQKVDLHSQIKKEEEELSTFNVHPHYQKIQIDADRLTKHIHEAANSTFFERHLLNSYKASIKEESSPTSTSVERVYREAGLIFPDHLHRHLEEVKTFHQTIVANRRDFLEGEIKRLQDRCKDRDTKIEIWSNERAKLLQILETHGALNEFVLLKKRHSRLVENLNAVTRMLNNLRTLRESKSQLTIESEQIHQKMNREFDEREEIRTKSIALFSQFSRKLYQFEGRLILEVSKKGFVFDTEFERSSSSGVSLMKVFLYDLTLASLWAEKQVSPKILIHDSALFDPVDEKQVATALQTAAEESEKRGFQYICALNSDKVPREWSSPDFNLDPYIRHTLTDRVPEGSLLGIRYN